MRRARIPISAYEDLAQVFHWAFKEHYTLALTGEYKRLRRTEIVLAQREQQGKSAVRKYGKRKVYGSGLRGRSKKPNIYHGLICTHALVCCWLCRKEGKMIAERKFKGLFFKPEWGILYPSDRILLFEFLTANNFNHGGLAKLKVTNYEKNLYRISYKPIVLFVIERPREIVKGFVERVKPTKGSFYFSDLKTFLAQDYGKHLKEKIYFRGSDGKEDSII